MSADLLHFAWLAGAICALGAAGLGLLAMGLQDRQWRCAGLGAVVFSFGISGIAFLR